MAAAIVSNSKPHSHKWFAPSNFKLVLPHFGSKSKPQVPSTATKIRSIQEDYQKVFRHFDANGDGKISSEELCTYFASIGDSMSSEEAQIAVTEFDGNGDNFLAFKDFVRLMERDQGEANDDLKRAFQMFEADKGCGCITPKGLQRMLNRLGDAKSYQECISMIRVFDLDGNGVLDFHEFLHMMTSN
ncbi:putative calcium-binding protein CML41 [Morus notabilis]|uniref:Putative calcium-binding protein CML41 n=2 Tax=Morus notabilis TaxID=981085 RepID=W9S3N7_9ROSA|nr:putative calcium-binding protein CML41 [Morus notabilis]